MSFVFDSDEEAAPRPKPPAAKPAPAARQLDFSLGASSSGGGAGRPAPPAAAVRYVFKVDITQPVSAGGLGESKVIVHSVAVGGKWSAKGTMGLVTRTFGEEPEEDYAAHPAALGDARFVAVSNRYSSGKLWVCNLYAQKAAGRGPPELVWDALLTGLARIQTFAAGHSAAVHLARLRYDIPALNWPKVHDALVKELVAHGVPVLVYSSDKDDRARYGASDGPGSLQRTPTAAPGPAVVPAAAAPAPPPAMPVGEVLKGQNVVVSGFSAAADAALKEKITRMGGTVQPKWRSWGAASHFLVCETLTEEFAHVEKLGGKVVVGRYVDQCLAHSRRLPFDGFLYSPGGSGSAPAAAATVTAAPSPTPAPAPAPAPVPVAAPPPSSPAKRRVSDAAEASPKKQPKAQPSAKSAPRRFDLQNVFSGLTLFIDSEGVGGNPFNTQKQLARYIVAYDGTVAQHFDAKLVDVVVAAGEDCAAARKTFGAHQGRLVTPAWVWECVNALRRVPMTPFLLH